jgi:hypothetical protein
MWGRKNIKNRKGAKREKGVNGESEKGRRRV